MMLMALLDQVADPLHCLSDKLLNWKFAIVGILVSRSIKESDIPELNFLFKMMYRNTPIRLICNWNLYNMLTDLHAEKCIFYHSRHNYQSHSIIS